MNAKQKKFCELYAITMNATESAIKAGYKENSAYSQGSRLLKNVEVQKQIAIAINQLNENLPEKEEIKRFWTMVMRDDKEKITNRLTASTNLAKALFMFNAEISAFDDYE